MIFFASQTRFRTPDEQEHEVHDDIDALLQGEQLESTTPTERNLTPAQKNLIKDLAKHKVTILKHQGMANHFRHLSQSGTIFPDYTQPALHLRDYKTFSSDSKSRLNTITKTFQRSVLELLSAHHDEVAANTKLLVDSRNDSITSIYSQHEVKISQRFEERFFKCLLLAMESESDDSNEAVDANVEREFRLSKSKGKRARVTRYSESEQEAPPPSTPSKQRKNTKQSDKKIAILSRGNLHQMKRNFIRHHSKKGEKCLFTSKADFNIVRVNLISVPSEIRSLVLTNEMQSSQEKVSTTAAATSSTATGTARKLGLFMLDSDPMNETFKDTDKVDVIEELRISPSQSSDQTNSRGDLVQKSLESFIEIRKPDNQTKLMEMIEKLRHKVDRLSVDRKVTGASMFGPTSTAPATALETEMSRCYSKMKKWHEVKNLTELVAAFDHIALYPKNKGELEEFGDGGAVLRCETCFVLYRDRARMLTPARAAKSFLPTVNSSAQENIFP
eukprot:gene20913-22967_t